MEQRKLMSLEFKQSPSLISNIDVTVLNANELDIKVEALDFVNLNRDNYQIIIWKNNLTPPYEDLDENVVAIANIPSNSSKASMTLRCDSLGVNYYSGIYCVGFLMGDKLSSVCSFASLVSGTEVSVFQSAVYISSVGVSQVSVGFVTPVNNNPESNRQYIDVFDAEGSVNRNSVLNIRGSFSSTATGQVVLHIKEGMKLERGKSYRALYDFNGDFESYGAEAFFTIPK